MGPISLFREGKEKLWQGAEFVHKGIASPRSPKSLNFKGGERALLKTDGALFQLG
jgi:hypothetical protein